MFYTFCEIGRDKKLLDFYLENIITNIDTSRLYIDNHIVMKHIIKSNKYNGFKIVRGAYHNQDKKTGLLYLKKDSFSLKLLINSPPNICFNL